jgi:avidin family protein
MGLDGTWYNELGSTLVIENVSSGLVEGTYETATSGGGCATGTFTLVGRTDTDSGGQTVGFSVTWTNGQSNCYSTTSWAGQYQAVGGSEHFSALWLLAMATPESEDWASTLVGEDVFFRQPPAEEHVAAALRRKRHPHP